MKVKDFHTTKRRSYQGLNWISLVKMHNEWQIQINTLLQNQHNRKSLGLNNNNLYLNQVTSGYVTFK